MTTSTAQNEYKLAAILRSALGKPKKYQKEYLFFCPFCGHHKKKLSVNIEKNVYQCWVCTQAGRPQYLVRKFGKKEKYLEYLELIGETKIASSEDILMLLEHVELPNIEKEIKLPEGYRCLISDHSMLAHHPRRYLTKRGITQEEITRWKLGYCAYGDYANRIIIPSFSNSGYINYYIGRSYVKSNFNYLKPGKSRNIIFNDLNIDWSQPVVLVEGVFDALKAGQNTIPILGSYLAPDSALLYRIVESQVPVYMALDKDAASKQKVISKRLKRYGIQVYIVDIGDYDDVGEMPVGVFQERLKTAEKLDDLYDIRSSILNGVTLW